MTKKQELKKLLIEIKKAVDEKINTIEKVNEAPTQQAVGYLPIGLIDVASGDSSQSLQAAGYLNENENEADGYVAHYSQALQDVVYPDL